MDAENAAFVLHQACQVIGADTILKVKKRAGEMAGDNVEIRMRTADSEHFKYQIMLTEAIARVSTSVTKKSEFAYKLMLAHQVADSDARKTSNTFHAQVSQSIPKVVVLVCFGSDSTEHIEFAKGQLVFP